MLVEIRITSKSRGKWREKMEKFFIIDSINSFALMEDLENFLKKETFKLEGKKDEKKK